MPAEITSTVVLVTIDTANLPTDTVLVYGGGGKTLALAGVGSVRNLAAWLRTSGYRIAVVDVVVGGGRTRPLGAFGGGRLVRDSAANAWHGEVLA